MLAVGVDPAAVRVVVLERPAIARRDPDRQPAVPSKRQHLRAVLARHVRRPIGGTVVDNEDIRIGQQASEVVEHRRQILLLVPRRNEDERVAHAYPRRASSARAARSCRRHTAAAAISHTNARAPCATAATWNEVWIPRGSKSREKKNRVR